ncbi:hypothetical protein SprV_0200672500 [Sparganum proliferum]
MGLWLPALTVISGAAGLRNMRGKCRNTNGAVKLSDLESAFTKRPQRSLDNYVQRLQRNSDRSNCTENNPGCSTGDRPSSSQLPAMYQIFKIIYFNKFLPFDRSSK